MQTPRRFLPSIALLSAFEAAARTASFTAAARELSLTQSAISRQIRLLEAQLGVELFSRERQTVRLTPAGEAYARDIRDALRRISAASLNLRANPRGGTLNLAILPTFGTRWLAPRLPDFLARHPGITVNLATRLVEFDFRLDTMDAAIHFGSPTWSGAEHLRLMAEDVAPMASPAFAAARLGDPAKAASEVDVAHLREMPLLHVVSRPDAWERWFAAHGISAEGVTGMLFDQFATVAAAAMSGLGVALLPTFLVARELERGELVLLGGKPQPSHERYHLVWPPDRAAYPPLVAFRDWIGDAAKA
ncbi:LysR family transcriptional regulator [Aureimonas sp. Leaf454]|uniref:LysR family transcriptional regulator n=1 Tax=Aureimonas sp. Leaf454 TaxID=1736381 RepID=UPI0006FB7507|nr:LysR family transcriptional regulator [Aureimonas sp. Leaf454]KQT43020.1 LysR family transcriptional regulator [Aureimonas sp. Leaf454]